ncbi:MAG: GNAT family N-acetyltransferase [Lachnospiraceae bacterium]|nr:GNAT family N-acetyltransferase [Lachnospiraceae bacterium]
MLERVFCHIGKAEEPGEQDWECFRRQAANALLVTDSQQVIDRAAREWSRLGSHSTRIVPIIGVEKDGTESLSGCNYVVQRIEDLDDEFLDRVYRRVHRLPWTIIETKRCIVRETTEGDLDRLYEIYADPAITRYMEGLYRSREEEASYLREYQDRIYAFYGFGVWSIIEKQSGRMIGRAGISMRQDYEEPELGFCIDHDFWHQGYAYEVCSAILRFMVETYEIPVIQALVQKENAASVSLLERLGFSWEGQAVLEGIQHERYLYFGENDQNNSEQ